MVSLSSSSSDPHDLLTCDVCVEQYDDKNHLAKFLICHHTFCVHCLSVLVRDKQAKLGYMPHTIECPNCRSPTDLPENGVAGLQTNFYIDCMRETFEKIGQPKVKGCHKHSNQPMSFFCETCGTAICRDCTVIDHKDTAGHSIANISHAEVSQRQALAGQVDAGHISLTQIQGSMQQLESEVALLTAAKDVAIKELETSMQRSLKQIERRKLQLTKAILDHYNAQQEALLGKREQLHKAVKTLGENVSKSEKLVKTGVLSEVVSTNKMLKKAIEDTKSNFAMLDLGKNYLAFDSITGWEAFEESLCRFGQIYFKGFLPTSIGFKSKGAKAGHKAVITVELFNHRGDKVPTATCPITVQITDPQDMKLAAVLCTTGPECTVTFSPQMSGLHKVSGLFLGQKLKSEQTHISVSSNNPILKFGEQGSGNGRFMSPRAVAIDNNNCLYVADTGNRLIQKLSANGEFLSQFSVNGHNEDCSTCDLALDVKNGLIFCTETLIGSAINPTMGNNVLVYNLEGEIQHVYTNNIMRCALCIATNSHGDIIVSDYLVHSLFMYDKQGNFLRRVGNSGTFNHPAFICVGEDDCIIVSDTNNDCIQIFSSEGTFIRQFSSSGSGKGQLKQPFGVATDGDNILVVDSGNRRIQVFKYDGTFVSFIESRNDPLLQPRGLAVTKDGYVYVADRDHHCIKKYKYKDMPDDKPESNLEQPKTPNTVCASPVNRGSACNSPVPNGTATCSESKRL